MTPASIAIATQPAIHYCQADWTWEGRMHDWNLWCVLSGEGFLAVNGHETPLVPGSCFLLSPGSLTRGYRKSKPDMHVFSCHFSISPKEDIAALDAVANRKRDAQNLILLRSLAAHALQWSDDQSARSEIGLYGFYSLLLFATSPDLKNSDTPQNDRRIEKAITAMTSELSKKWTVAALAQIAGLSVTQFNRLFRQREGISPNAYLIRLRIEEAKRIALSTDLNVAEMAQHLGYSDPYFFSRQFKQTTGYAPSQIRRQSH